MFSTILREMFAYIREFMLKQQAMTYFSTIISVPEVLAGACQERGMSKSAVACSFVFGDFINMSLCSCIYNTI